ncbi:MAG: TerB family tellurite resistance protein [Bdellovibrionales bacterium]|nr:TerB family tellurite resistance protein [Bdellovibrionales bacterium]
MSEHGKSLLTRLWEKFSDLGDQAGRLGVVGSFEHLVGIDEHKIDLAYAVLLVNIASIDGDFSPRESYYIKSQLKSHLGVEFEQAVKLVDEAKGIVNGDEDLNHFGEFLRNHLSHTSRQGLLDSIDGLIEEDHIDHPFEQDLRKRYVKLLGI